MTEYEPIRERPAPAVIDRLALLGAESPNAALADLGRRLGGGVAELVLESTAPGTGAIAIWRNEEPDPGRRRRTTVVVPGEPPWHLHVVALDSLATDRLERAAVAIAAWREAHLARSRAGSRLDERTRELDLIQALGRRAAEARTPAELFHGAVGALARGEDLDAALVATSVDGAPDVALWIGRPFAAACVDRLIARAGAILAWEPDAAPAPAVVEFDDHDAELEARTSYREDELVVLPILRRKRAVAVLLCLPAGSATEAGLRLAYAAGNQLAVHLDRILAAREAEAGRFRTILDSMAQAVFLTDAGLRTMQANRAGRELVARLAPDAAVPVEEVLRRLGALDVVERAGAGEPDLARGAGALEPDQAFEVTVTPLADSGTGSDGMVVVVADVTESRRMQRHLAQSERMSSLGQMISGTAHELNNPLTSVLGYAQLLRATVRGDAKTATRLETLQREAERCQKIVHNLLAFARRRDPVRRPVDLNGVVRSTMMLLDYQLRVSSVRVEAELSVELPPVDGDEHQLQQVLVNLLTNARQAIQEAGRPGVVRLWTDRTPDGAVELVIADDGPGIPDAVRDRIFDPFFTTKGEGTGTGLGLAIVYGVIASHGGTIDVGTSDHGGAQFRIVLPAGGTRRATGSGAAPAEPPRAVGRILVVDDEPHVARMICDALAEEGHETLAVASADEALVSLAHRRWDAVISDLRMPGLGAEALVEAIRQRSPALARRVILTTGDTVSPEPLRFVERAGLELLEKPFDLDRLRRMVRARLADPGED